MKDKDKIDFLNGFTRELVKHSSTQQFSRPVRRVFRPIQPEEKFMPELISIQKPKPQRPIEELEPTRLGNIEIPRPKISEPIQSMQFSPSTSITAIPSQMPSEFSLGKLDPLLQDRAVTSIECPGPGKMLAIRSFGRPNLTKIFLDEREIREVIGTFSEIARIPIVAGLFKAAIGNLLITAVLSDFVGSRFIITTGKIV